MTPQVPIGAEEQIYGCSLRGVPAAPRLLEILLEIIEAVGMTADGGPDIRHYPNAAGAGGIGVQIYQPLTESWIVGGTWLQHDCTRVVLSSCKRFDADRVKKILQRNIGKIMHQIEGNL